MTNQWEFCFLLQIISKGIMFINDIISKEGIYFVTKFFNVNQSLKVVRVVRCSFTSNLEKSKHKMCEPLVLPYISVLMPGEKKL